LDDQATFQLLIPGQTVAPDALGIWQTRPAQTATTPKGDGEPAVTWQVELPADTSQAWDVLGQQRALLNGAERALPWAEGRLEAIAREAPPPGADLPPSYSVTWDDGLRPERELEAWLLAEQGVEQYGRLGDLRDSLLGAAREASAFIEQLRWSLTPSATVQTAAGGQPLGHTRVAWLGDMNTLWWRDVNLEEAALHRQTLALALASRQAWMRLALMVTSGAARLAALLSSPFAIPASYRFITQMLAEFRLFSQTLQQGSKSH
jgi:hypothetical protein